MAMAKTKDDDFVSAQSRVVEALARLDAASQAVLAAPRLTAHEKESIQAEITRSWETHTGDLNAKLETLREENDALRDENSQLATQLHKAQQDYLDLKETSDTVAERLDGQVRQIDLLLTAAAAHA